MEGGDPAEEELRELPLGSVNSPGDLRPGGVIAPYPARGPSGLL